MPAESYADFIKRDPPPDLEALVREHGDWQDVTEPAWQEFRLSTFRWRLRMLFRG